MRFLRPLLVLVILVASTGTALSQKINPDDYRNGPKVVQAFRPIVAKPSEATVRVLADDKDVAFGTIVEADGWIITKWSEIKNKTKLVCKLKDGKLLDARLVGVKDSGQDAYDLALLKVEAKGLPIVEWRDSKEAKVGKWVASAGITENPIAVGFVSVATRKFKAGDQPFKFSNTNAGYMGVGLQPGMGGAKVNTVAPKGPAEKAGVKVNDLIYEAAGKAIANDEVLIETIGTMKPGDEVTLKIIREDEDLELKVTLAKRPKELAGNPQETMGTKLNHRRGGFPVILQHDSGIRPEDCGGPLVDLDGKVVGINIARAGRTETYAIPAEEIQKIVPDLKTGKFLPKDDLAKVDPLPKKPNPNLILRAAAGLNKDTPNKTRPGAFMRVHEVKLSAGETYIIEMICNDKTVDPYIVLEDDKGKKLAEDDDGGGFPNAKLVFRAPADGAYRIIATSFNPGEVGNYTLTVRKQENPTKK